MNLYDTMYGRLPNLVIGFHGCDESTFEKVLNQKQMLHSSTNSGFRNFVAFAVGIFYQIGGAWLIKKIAELGTIAAVFVRKHPILSSYMNEKNL